MTTATSVAVPEDRPATDARPMVLLFGITLSLSSVLMFLLEPMAAKMVLPLLGGAPAVWNTCVVFFQAMLLAGYAYAHMGPAWIGVRLHAALHVVLLLASFLTVQVYIGTAITPEGHPIAWLLLLLLRTIGLPFFVLTTTAPLLQRWFSSTDHPSAHDPYFLYAASNLGSLAGLVLYPAVVEPTLRLRDQAGWWVYGYAAFAALTIGCAAVLWRRSSAPSNRAERVSRTFASVVPDVEITAVRRLRWVALAFAPSSLMLAVTTFFSTDIAPVPLLWVLPLALYLLTFVLAFNSQPRYPHAVVSRAFPLLLVVLVLFIVLQVMGPLMVVLPAHLIGFFLAALVCHRELADDRPSARHLTEFYFWIALGGVLGSLFNTLAAPLVFSGTAEYPIVLALVCLLRRTSGSSGSARTFAIAGLAGALAIAVVRLVPAEQPQAVITSLLAVPALLAFSISRTRLPFAMAIALMLLASAVRPDVSGTVLHAERTFFGTYRVRLEPDRQYRTLSHGTTLHGVQSVARERQGEALSYFHREGPFGDVARNVPQAAQHSDVAVIGLGVGSLASYRRPNQHWTFYEIDPAVERIARNGEHFTYLSDCGAACRVVIGDARLSLNATSDRFGLLVLDAFSSDAIPMHLVTREALDLYLARLAPGGAFAFHISNRHLDLEPVLARLADYAHLTAVIRRDAVQGKTADGRTGSTWVAMARRPEHLGALVSDPRWNPIRLDPAMKLWTDDFSNILQVLRKR